MNIEDQTRKITIHKPTEHPMRNIFLLSRLCDVKSRKITIAMKENIICIAYCTTNNPKELKFGLLRLLNF